MVPLKCLSVLNSVLLPLPIKLKADGTQTVTRTHFLINFPTNFSSNFHTGKGENVWDHLTHTNPDAIKDRTNGDIACDSYHLWRQDIELLKYLGVNYYRFSLSWPRLLPTGLTNKINPDGVRYYNDLINELLANNIEPLVTIFHWDLPQPLQEFGGWANPQIADYFQDYAEIVFRLFGDRVKKWITINEPSSICVDIYRGDSAPIIFSDGIGTYLCGKTLLLAHAKAYRIYDHLFRSKQGGKPYAVSIQ